MLDIITQELLAYATRLRKGSKYWFVCCPFHTDKTPSCKVHVVDGKYPAGSFKCFGCGEYGDWNKFANKAGLKGISLVDNYREFASIKKPHTESYDEVMALPWKRSDGDWRGITYATIKAVGGKKVFSDRFNDTCLYLPTLIYGEHVGGITCALEKRDTLSYINTPGKWSLTSLYPYDYIANLVESKELDYVVIVEGPRDALRLIQNGVPALAALGVESWSKAKDDLVYSLGTSTVVKFTDGDSAGNKLSRRLDDLLLRMVKVKVEFGEDPANCKLSKILTIKKRYG